MLFNNLRYKYIYIISVPLFFFYSNNQKMLVKYFVCNGKP